MGGPYYPEELCRPVSGQILANHKSTSLCDDRTAGCDHRFSGYNGKK